MAEKKNGDILYADDFNGKQDKFGTVSYASSPKYLMLNINGYVDPTSGKFIQLSPSDITSTHINVTNAEISGKVKFDNSLIIGNVGVLGFDFELPTTTTPGKIKTGHPSINKLNFSNGSGTSDIQLGGIKVPTADNDAANKKYVDDITTQIGTQLSTLNTINSTLDYSVNVDLRNSDFEIKENTLKIYNICSPVFMIGGKLKIKAKTSLTKDLLLNIALSEQHLNVENLVVFLCNVNCNNEKQSGGFYINKSGNTLDFAVTVKAGLDISIPMTCEVMIIGRV